MKITGVWRTRQIKIDGHLISPLKSQTICNHSPDGFNWGYCGSGPAQLALALLLKFTTREVAKQAYQAFKFDIVSNLPQSDFELDAEKIVLWIKEWKANWEMRP